jgi:PilZ domain
MESAGRKRRAVRRTCVLPLELSQGEGTQSLKCDTTDVSPYGCYVTLLSTFPKGAVLEIILWAGSARLSCHGKVITADAGVGNGIEFTDMPDDVRALIAKYLDKIKAPEAGSGLILR